METPSPSPSHASNEDPIALDAEYLPPPSFLGLDSGSWEQQSESLLDPIASYGDIPFAGLDGLGIPYDFTFGNDFLGLPSPPNTNTSYDPPSPSNGFASSASSNMDMPASLDPALTSAAPSVNIEQPSPECSGTTKRKGDGTRTKASHTTIERRYRDNLNSGMTGLRQAVPALRILDKSILPPPGVVDIVDERGYVDGVKAAKKNSKSTILGKATEYIMVLKRRENRLRTEIHALKIFVIENVPNGVNTLAEWEANHQAQFGGEQSDELPPQDSMVEEDDDEEEGSRPVKKQRVKPAEATKKEVKKVSAPPPIGPNGEPLKRKRGRPRKIPASGTNSSELPLSLGETQFLASPQTLTTMETQPVRYLLTAFAFFSFLGNLPSSTTSFATSHQGSVLNQLPAQLSITASWWDGGLLQAAQLVTSVLLLLSLLAPHLPASVQSSKMMQIFSVSTVVSSKAPVFQKEIKITQPLPEATVTKLADACGLISDFWRHLLGRPNSKAYVASWRKLAQEYLLQDKDISWIRRLRIYYVLAADPQAAIERTLIGYPMFTSSAAKEWEELGKTDNSIRKLAIDTGIQDSSRLLHEAMDDGANTIMELDVILARGRFAAVLNTQAHQVFGEKVLGSPCRDDAGDAQGADLTTLKQSANALGSDFALLVSALCDLHSTVPTYPDIMAMGFKGNLASARDVLRATQLFLQLFPNRVPTAKAEQGPLSPPPSPSNVRNRYTANRQHELRCLLGREVFEQSAIDQARDVIVDLLTRTQ